MLGRMLRYPFGAVRSRALAGRLLGPEVLHGLAGLGSSEALLRELQRRGLCDIGIPVANALQRRFHALGRTIARSLPAAARAVVEAYLARAELENRKALCRAIVKGVGWQELQPLLTPVAGAGRVERLAGADGLAELASLLPPSPFRDALRQALKRPDSEQLFMLETTLDKDYWETLHGRIGRFGWLDRQAATELLGLRADIDRCAVVLRGWRAGLSRRWVLEALPSLGSLLPAEAVWKALGRDDPAPALRRLFPAGAPEEPLGRSGEVWLLRRLARPMRQLVRSVPFDPSVPLAVLLLGELELRDLCAIHSGLQAGASAATIRAALSLGGG